MSSVCLIIACLANFFPFFFLHLFNSREFSVNFSSIFFLFSFSIRIRSNVSHLCVIGTILILNSILQVGGEFWEIFLRFSLLRSLMVFFSFLRWRGEFLRGDIFISLNDSYEKKLWDFDFSGKSLDCIALQ